MIMLNVVALFGNAFVSGMLLEDRGFAFWLNVFFAFLNLGLIGINILS